MAAPSTTAVRPVVPNRPVAPPAPGKAAIPAPPVAVKSPVAAAPVAATPVAATPVAAPAVAPVAPAIAPPVVAAAPVAPVAVAPAAPVAATSAQPTAAPTTPKKRGRKKADPNTPKTAKAVYPGLLATEMQTGADGVATLVYVMNEDGTHKRLKLSALPADYNSRQHEKLTEADFVDAPLWMEFRATELQTKANSLFKRAKETRALGGVTDKKRAQKLVAMRAKMKELADQLKAQGVDVDALLAAQVAADESAPEMETAETTTETAAAN